jgi:hypothetical protein
MTQSTKMIGDYTPGFLFDTLRKKMNLRSDHALVSGRFSPALASIKSRA